MKKKIILLLTFLIVINISSSILSLSFNEKLRIGLKTSAAFMGLYSILTLYAYAQDKAQEKANLKFIDEFPKKLEHSKQTGTIYVLSKYDFTYLTNNQLDITNKSKIIQKPLAIMILNN